MHVSIPEYMSQKAGWVICDLVEAIIATRIKCVLAWIVKVWEGVQKNALQVAKQESMIAVTHAHTFTRRTCM